MLKTQSSLKADKHVLYSLAQAKRRVEYWQRRLRLTDWTIHVSIVRAHQLDSANQVRLGDVGVLEVKQIAHVRLLHPADFVTDMGYIETHDHELTIIHELLHVRLHGVQDDAPRVRYLSEERAVHALSEALKLFDQRGSPNGRTTQRRHRSNDRGRLRRSKTAHR